MSGSDSNFWVNSSGLMSAGNSERDSAAGDPTHGYALGDVVIPIPLQLISSSTDPVITRIGAGSYKKSLVVGTTHNVLISIPQVLRTFVASAGITANPHGMKIRSLQLNYRVNTANLTSITLKVYTLSLAAADPIPTATEQASVQSGGALTFGTPGYQVIATVTTPEFVTTLDNEFVGEAVIVTPASSVCDILGATARVSYALY